MFVKTTRSDWGEEADTDEGTRIFGMPLSYALRKNGTKVHIIPPLVKGTIQWIEDNGTATPTLTAVGAYRNLLSAD